MPQQLIMRLFGILLTVPAALISIAVHESAHGYVSYKQGDPTARNLGRITLNPLKHFDIMGFICMVLFRVGWAKPVPVNPRYYKNPRRGMAITAAAGPVSNIIMAFIGVIGYELVGLIFREMNTAYYICVTIYMFFQVFASLNVFLAIFNLIPVPPFDGSRIAYIFMPPKAYFGIMKYERYIMLGMIAILWLGVLDTPLDFLSTSILNGMEWLVELVPIFK
ncbi:MAG: site-2 protease family protein [Ruminococcaceae bacterium]|nr:site-2 protease family protein [Oscillospiraceae bacterium]